MLIQHAEKLSQPLRMRWPCGRRYQIAVHHGFRHLTGCKRSAGHLHLRRAGWITAHLPALHDSGRREDLRSMTNGRNGLVLPGEVADHLQHLWIKPQVFRSAAPRQHKAVIIFWPDFGKSRVQSEVVPALLGVGLVAFEVDQTYTEKRGHNFTLNATF